MSTSRISDKVASSIGAVVTRVSRGLGNGRESAPSGAGTTTADGRTLDWPALQELSTLVKINYGHLCDSNTHLEAIALTADFDDDELRESTQAQNEQYRREYRLSLLNLNQRLTNASYLELPTETDFKSRTISTAGEYDREDEGDEMSKPFAQMLDVITRQDEPCGRKKMKKLTKGKPEYVDLYSAL